MVRPRPSHVLLILLGLLMSVVMLVVLIPRVSHLAIHPAKPPMPPATTPAKIATAPAHHGWLTFGHILLLFGVSGLLSVFSLAGWVVYLVRRRLANRLSREYGLYELKLSMHDETKPQDLIDMIEALGNAVREFPEQRARDGQPFIAFEAHYGPGQGGEPEWVLCVRCETALVSSVDGIISGAYPDIRVGYEFIGPPQEITGVIPTPGHVLRYRKERSFVYPIVDDTERASSSPLEAIAQAQVALAVPSTVRFQLTPCAVTVERLARERFRRHENKLARRESFTRDAGLMSTLNRAEMTAASEAQDHSWFWFEVQVAVADSRENANRVSAALQGRRGENRLKRRWMIVREDLYRRRFPTGYPPLLPSPTLRTLVSASDIAHLVELPGARMKGVPVRRLALPRVPAPPEVGFARDDPQPELPPPEDPDQGGSP
ncbi:MAG TPA: hypothetical protein VGY76_10525 [Solirubrobacteraceae bacterium]|nr:hypothetical protein [Solirubrobacteraceae bacterium]